MAGKNKNQPACKPGSVWGVAPPRRPFIWDVCCQTPQAINPGGGPEDGLDAAALPARVRPPLFDLAPGGVCPAADVTGRAVRSYRTVSPFPRSEARGGLFSVALSLGSPPAAVSRHRSFKEPGLSSTGFAVALAAFRAAFAITLRQRPSGRLVDRDKGWAAPNVKSFRCAATQSAVAPSARRLPCPRLRHRRRERSRSAATIHHPPRACRRARRDCRARAETVGIVIFGTRQLDARANGGCVGHLDCKSSEQRHYRHQRRLHFQQALHLHFHRTRHEVLRR